MKVNIYSYSLRSFMVFNFFKAKKLPDSFAVLDFGSSSVGAAIFDSSRYTSSGILSVVGVGCEEYPQDTLVSGIISSIEQFRNTAKVSLKKASAACGFNPSLIVTCLSGEFSKAISAKVKIVRKETDKVLSEKEWEGYERKIKETLLLDAESEMAAITGNAESEVVVVESILSSVATDATEGLSKAPLGKIITEIVGDYLITFTQRDTLELMKDVIRNLRKKELFYTSRIANLVRLLTAEDRNLNTIFISLDGTGTDVAVVLGGFLIGVRSIPFGYNFFNVDSGSEVADWISMISVTLSDFEGVKSFPARIILLGERSKTTLVEAVLHSFPWTKKFPFTGRPEIEYLEDKLNLPFVEDKTGKMDEFMMLVMLSQSFRDYAKDRA